MALSELDAFEAVEAARKVKRTPEQKRAWAEMVAELAHTQDLIAGANIPADQVDQITEHLRAIARVAENHQVPETSRMWRASISDPRRGQSLLPAFTNVQMVDGTFSMNLTFGEFHLGANRVVHGGVQALTFDEALGYMLIKGGYPVARTGYLKTEFKAPAPINVELTLTGWVERIEGRKIFIQGELLWGDTVCTKAEGLWIALKPGNR